MHTKITKCLFPAAGYGTRFLPATKSIPKEMLPVCNKPLIHYGIEEAMQAGIEEMCIVTGRNKEAISNYFDVQHELEGMIRGTPVDLLLDPVREIMDKLVFTYVRQKHIIGLGDAILTGKPLIDNRPFAVLLADDLCIDVAGYSLLNHMCELFKVHKCSIVAVQRVDKKDLHNYGVIVGTAMDEGLIRVTRMIEKPRPGDIDSDLAIIGRYILTPDIFDILQKTKPDDKGEIQLTEAMNQQAQAGRVLAFRFDGTRFDCGQMTGMIDATNYIYESTLKTRCQKDKS